jgi:K+-sensing histidine kinase KdpD
MVLKINENNTASQWKQFLASVAALAVVSYMDYLTGSEVLLVVFYFIPIAICAWHQRRETVLLLALVGGVCWVLADYYSGHQYSHPLYYFWNGFICFASFAAFGLVLHRLKASLDEQARGREELAKALDELKASTSEIQKLQKELHVVCAWTNRIRIEGQWMTFNKFLTRHLHLNVSHGMSPEAEDNMIKNIEQLEQMASDDDKDQRFLQPALVPTKHENRPPSP